MTEQIQEDAPVSKVPSPTQLLYRSRGGSWHRGHVDGGAVHRNPVSQSPHQPLVLSQGRAMILFSPNSKSRVFRAHGCTSDLLKPREKSVLVAPPLPKILCSLSIVHALLSIILNLSDYEILAGQAALR